MADIFQTAFANGFSGIRKSMYFDYNFIEVCSYGSYWYYSSFGSDNGLAPTRWHAIIWTNNCPVYWRRYASLALNDFKDIGDFEVMIVSCLVMVLHRSVNYYGMTKLGLSIYT